MNKITQEYLTELFRKYNAAYFDGQLRNCSCSVLYGYRELGMYTHHKESDGTIRGRVWVARNIDWTERSLRSVLVHEMVHHWIWQTYRHDSGIMGHGWRFMKKCRELNRAYDLNLKRVNREIPRPKRK